MNLELRLWNGIWMRAILSVVLSVLICWLFIDRPYKYNARIIRQSSFEYQRQTDFFDLDYDGRSEKVRSIMNGTHLSSLIIYEWDDDMVDQFNVEGSLIERSRLFAGDFDSNQQAELYLFTHSGDSLFLNVIDPFSRESIVPMRKFIPGCSLFHDEARYTITGHILEDLNDDGYKEFYFSVIAGFTLSPRNVFCYDLLNDSVYVSPPAGTGPRLYLRSEDLDQDGKLEIWGPVNGWDNYKDSIVDYSDSSAWLMVFSHELDFEFEPIEFPGFGTRVDAQMYESTYGRELATLKTYKGNRDNIKPELLLVSPKGKIRTRIVLKELDDSGNAQIYVHNSRIHVWDSKGRFILFDKELKEVSRIKKDFAQSLFLGIHPFSDHGDALYFLSDQGLLSICSHDFKILTEIQLSSGSVSFLNIQKLNTLDVPWGINIKGSRFSGLISFELNPARNLMFLYVALIFLAIFSFILLIQQWQIRTETRKRELERKMQTLQLQSLKSQMNPHFIFNALNSISAMYVKGDTLRADSFLTRFSRMIREVVDSSEKVVVTLEDEVEFVRNYLELEKIRNGENFNFTIEVPENCKQTNLPSMSIHAFVENSVKHAFPDKSAAMLIRIQALVKKGKVYVSISDNGIGFAMAENQVQRTGRGLKMISGIIKNYSIISGKEMSYTISNNSVNDNLSAGTFVELVIEA